MGMEEQAALAELRRMIRQLSPERQEAFEDALQDVSVLVNTHNDMASIAMQVYLLENCE